MRKQAAIIPPGVFTIDPSSSEPIHRQLYSSLRHAILNRQLSPGTQLPSTRMLAIELGLARGTVVNAFSQLFAEGYLESKHGGGTYVARELPEDLLQIPSEQPSQPGPEQAHRALSRRGHAMTSIHFPPAADHTPIKPFRPGLAALDAFPLKLWSQIVARRTRQRSRDLLSYGDPAGFRPLREAIADYLRSARGVNCQTDQVVIVSGSQQALDLAARLLLDPGDAVLVEDPCYPGARGAFTGAGGRLVPIPVDREGMNVAVGVARCADARMVYVTPSHQYPLGVTMSLPRRLALLEWARSANAWILEDDYDSEFRYTGRPLAALQGLDAANRTIYTGTFSKVLFPALRLGYIVVPADLIEDVVAARTMIDFHVPTFEQLVLNDFIAEGHFARHIRHMRALYAERQSIFVSAAQQLADWLTVEPSEAGMYLIGWLPEDIDDQTIARHALSYGIEAPPLSAYRIEPQPTNGLLLGYTTFQEDEIREGVRRLAAARRSMKG